MRRIDFAIFDLIEPTFGFHVGNHTLACLAASRDQRRVRHGC
jgi:hypothetical protein